MKIKNNKICLICGEVYSYCPSCEEFKILPRWMALFDKDNCHEIFTIVSEFNQGVISAGEAHDRLLAQDLSEKERYSEQVREAIDKILKEGKPAKVVKKPLYNKEETRSEDETKDTDETVIRVSKGKKIKNGGQ